MKFKYGDIVYFKLIYDEDFQNATSSFYQILHFDVKRNAYLVVGFIPYSPLAPDHYYRAFIKEEDLGSIDELKEDAYKPGITSDDKLYKDDIELYKNTRLIDEYKTQRLLIEYKLYYKKEYPNLHDYIIENWKKEHGES